ncbi:hypothetical protein B5K05_13270 [Rhizobium phaseoli]|uniref:trypsin-like serine peptidase n=1 Tax=Rhizobium phaseoli TaxID=396 RepID=UPI000E0CC012|nr:serine protease [Rhizobium phaseoli]RDJ10100.1 hypothetical protein B5K04_13245 [Rhizobium phaseoli]RDJ14100.1 hypothetical protein B5K05_13270 [Rhizobium phaseoli]
MAWWKERIARVETDPSQANGFPDRVDPQATIYDGPPDEDFTAWEQRNKERKHFVCAIYFEFGGGMKFGTGILVGPDLVLTNYHVIEECEKNREGRHVQTLRCRFDYFRSPDGTVSGDVIEVALAPHDWLVEFSKFSSFDLTGDETGRSPDDLDYAIIRLARKIGLEPLGDGDDDLADLRGWETFPRNAGLPETNEIIVILHHPIEPRTEPPQLPLRRSENKVLGVTHDGLRIRHDASTAPGSSGSPCFGRNGVFVAVHHGAQKVHAGASASWNQSIPVKEIVRHLAQKGHQGILDNRPSESAKHAYAAPRSAEPVADKQRINDMLSKQRATIARVLMDRNRPEVDIIQSKLSQGMVHVITCREIDRYLRFLERLTNLSLPLNTVGLQYVRQRRVFLESGKISASRVWDKATIPRPERERSPDRRIQDILDAIGETDTEDKGWLIEIATKIDECSFDGEKALAVGLAKRCAETYSPAGLQIFLVYHDGVSTSVSDKWLEKRKQLASMWLPTATPPGAGVCFMLDDIGVSDLDPWCNDLNAVWKIDETDLRTKIGARFGNGAKLAMSEVEQRLESLILECVEIRNRAG